jgi:hypothetical protein
MSIANRIRTIVAGIAVSACLMGAGQAIAQEYLMKVQVSGLKPAVTTSFTSHRFTNCGKTGRFGPTLDQCQSAYAGSKILNTESHTFSVNSGYQYWTIPADGVYRISAAGAHGGGGLDGSPSGGKGIHLQGEFSLSKGDQLIMVIGQAGQHGPNQYSGGGGGGASYVAKGESPATSEPLLIAGGGGGHNPGYFGDGSTHQYPIDARAGNNGDMSRNMIGYRGNGASFSFNGRTFYNFGYRDYDAQSFVLSARGALNDSCYGIQGGFGGGGSPHCFNGAGGGGYTGGAGGKDQYHSGEGGGSLNNGSNPVTIGASDAVHGFVEIELVK